MDEEALSTALLGVKDADLFEELEILRSGLALGYAVLHQVLDSAVGALEHETG
jgi:hypothetical protein